MNNIFISYRREDSEGFARGLFQSLVGVFGADRVFMDVEAIGLGTDFVEAIDKSLAGCGALLVLIGKGWIDCTDAEGRRRLDDPQDFVRMEVAKALEQNVRVIPVLVKGARMPPADALPEVLRPLTRRQALELRHERWKQDVDHLTSALSQLLSLERLDARTLSPPPPPPVKKRSASRLVGSLAAAVVVAVLAVTGYTLFTSRPTAPVSVPSDITDATDGDRDATPPAASIGMPRAEKPAAAPQPEPQVPAPTPKPSASINLSGLWVDADGVNVQISQQGNQVVSQAYNPLTGLAINAVWQISGQRVAFNWASNTGNQGVGDGTISRDGNTIDYRYVDHVTGEQGYSRLFRVVQ